MDDYDLSERDFEDNIEKDSFSGITHEPDTYLDIKTGCNCGNRCQEKTGPKHVTHHLNVIELSSKEKDLVVLAQIAALTPINGRTTYYFAGKKICRSFFCSLHGISEKKFKNLRAHFLLNGATPRIHSNTKRLPHNVTKKENIDDAVKFLDTYSTIHGMSLPGRVPGCRDDRVTLLPSNHTMVHVHRVYQESHSDGVTPLSYNMLIKTWKTFRPDLITAKPRSDLCFTRQTNMNLVLKSSNKSIDDKSKALITQEEHLRHAAAQREDYKLRIEIAKNTYGRGVNFSTHAKLNSLDVTSIFSFDYAQQVMVPSNPFQPGPIYFKTPHKISLFGICNDVFNTQHTYVVDEQVDCGKGANTVISYLHHYLQTVSVGEKYLFLQADNCSGQNKNNFMIQYLCWRVANGLHSKISINFMLAGHTKFSPDRCFDLIKQNFRRTFASSVYDVENVINGSSNDGTNIAVLVGQQTKKGEWFSSVKVFDWQNMFKNCFIPFPSIKKYHHFRVDANEIGVVYAREYASSKEVKVELLKPNTSLELPEPSIVTPKGLTKERQEYLFKV